MLIPGKLFWLVVLTTSISLAMSRSASSQSPTSTQTSTPTAEWSEPTSTTTLVNALTGEIAWSAQKRERSTSTSWVTVTRYYSPKSSATPSILRITSSTHTLPGPTSPSTLAVFTSFNATKEDTRKGLDTLTIRSLRTAGITVACCIVVVLGIVIRHYYQRRRAKHSQGAAYEPDEALTGDNIQRSGLGDIPTGMERRSDAPRPLSPGLQDPAPLIQSEISHVHEVEDNSSQNIHGHVGTRPTSVRMPDGVSQHGAIELPSSRDPGNSPLPEYEDCVPYTRPFSFTGCETEYRPSPKRKSNSNCSGGQTDAE